jgi:hypothetical protein
MMCWVDFLKIYPIHRCESIMILTSMCWVDSDLYKLNPHIMIDVLGRSLKNLPNTSGAEVTVAKYENLTNTSGDLSARCVG